MCIVVYFIIVMMGYTAVWKVWKKIKRVISTAQLNVSLRLHLQPIDVVIYHDP